MNLASIKRRAANLREGALMVGAFVVAMAVVAGIVGVFLAICGVALRIVLKIAGVAQ